MCHAISIAFTGLRLRRGAIHPHMAATRHDACFARRSATDCRARVVDNGSVDEEVKIDGGMRLRSAVAFRNLCSITTRAYVNSGRNRKSGGR